MKKIISLFMLILPACFCFAQENNLYLNFRQILFRNLADTIEKTIPVKIYYSNKWVDTLRVDVSRENNSLKTLFEKSLENTGFSFYITDDNRLVLSKGPVKTNFSREYRDFIKHKLTMPDSVHYTEAPVIDEKTAINEEYKVFRIGNPSSAKNTGTATFSGTVRNLLNGEPVTGVIVYVDKLKAGTVTNGSGYYTMELPKGQYQIEYRMIGMKTTRRNIIIYSNGALDVSLIENTNQLNEVTISADKENNVRNVRMGIEKINVKMLKELPLGFGEADLIKSSLMLPGVESVGEASNGFNIRGGSVDQNLILLDGAPIINASHFFGFFSAFNSDMLEDVTLYKCGLPARFGGRVSSVMDITLKEGNHDKINVSGGISPIMGRLMIEGPLFNSKKNTFILSSRTTYSDWLLKKLKDPRLNQSSAGFYDLQGLFTFNPDPQNTISISGYLSHDDFDYYQEFALHYSNLASTIKWYHSYSPKLFSVFSGIISDYNYQNISDETDATSSSMKYFLDQSILKAEFTYLPNDKHKVDFGFNAIWYSLNPGVEVPYGLSSEVTPESLQKDQALEPSLYLSDDVEFSPRFLVSGGLRFTGYTSFGPTTQYMYKSGVTKSVESISDTIYYGPGKVVQFYPDLEYRLSARYIITPDLSVKGGIQRNYQYIDMISNTTSMSPTDIWMLSNYYIKPVRGDQYSLGVYKNFGTRDVDLSVEMYYKRLQNILDYKGGAELLMNDHLETDLLNGIGKAYGVELMLKKQSGKLTGWISYTYSRSLIKVDGEYEEEKINNGNYFPSNYDKPNDLKVVVNYKLIRRLSLTSNFMYSTGRPITYPVAYYNFYNVDRIYYSDRNEFRIPDYMRLDLSATVNGNLRAKKLNHSSLTFTVYNVLGRMNPYSIFFKVENGTVNGYEMSIIGRPIFMVTYSFRIRGNASTDF
ncbi:MAG: TonB-dependent receptor [Bacteroidales bacterium]|jgi:hypothetical protein